MVGVDNLAVIDTPDSLLVLDRNKSQDVKKVLDGLKESNISKFTQLPPIVKKPWKLHNFKSRNWLSSKKNHSFTRAKIEPAVASPARGALADIAR